MADILRGLGKEVDELHLSKEKEFDEWTSEEEEEVDEEYRRQVKESLGFDIDAHVRIQKWGISPHELGKYEPSEIGLYGRLGVHCFILEKDGFKSSLPAEIKKIVVESCETHTEPRSKLKSSNAIFYINFNAKSRDYISVVRRTMDGKTGHIILEVNSWDDKELFVNS